MHLRHKIINYYFFIVSFKDDIIFVKQLNTIYFVKKSILKIRYSIFELIRNYVDTHSFIQRKAA